MLRAMAVKFNKTFKATKCEFGFGAMAVFSQTLFEVCSDSRNGSNIETIRQLLFAVLTSRKCCTSVRSNQ